MQIEHIIFDLDDTLCDYSGARDRALKMCFELLPEMIERTHFERQYEIHEPELFHRFNLGATNKENYRLHRFLVPLKKCGLSNVSLAQSMNSLYLKQANEDIELFSGVTEMLQQLRRKGIRLTLLTNGPGDGQRKKLSVLGLKSCFDRVCISEEMGCAKPQHEAFFQAVINTGISLNNTLMVGDSLPMDIKPAEALGMQAFHVLKAAYLSRDMVALLEAQP